MKKNLFLLTFLMILTACDGAGENQETTVIQRSPTTVELEPNVENVRVNSLQRVGAFSIDFDNNSENNTFKIIVSESTIADKCNQETGLYSINDSSTIVQKDFSLKPSTLYNIKICSINEDNKSNDGYDTTFTTSSICDSNIPSYKDTKYDGKYYICNNTHLLEFKNNTLPSDLSELVVNYSIDLSSPELAGFRFQDMLEGFTIDFNNKPIRNLTSQFFYELRDMTIENVIFEDMNFSGDVALSRKLYGTVNFNNWYFKSGDFNVQSHYQSVFSYECDTLAGTYDEVNLNNIHFGKNWNYRQPFSILYSSLLAGTYLSSRCERINLNNVFIGSKLYLNSRYDRYPILVYNSANVRFNNVFYNGSAFLYNESPLTNNYYLTTYDNTTDLGVGVLYQAEVFAYPVDFSNVNDTVYTVQTNGIQHPNQVRINPASPTTETTFFVRNMNRTTKQLTIDYSGLNKLQLEDVSCASDEVLARYRLCYIRLTLPNATPQDMETITVNGNTIELHFVGSYESGGLADGINIITVPRSDINNQTYFETLGFDFGTSWTMGNDYPYVYRLD